MLQYSAAARQVAIQCDVATTRHVAIQCERPLPPSTRLTLQGTRADAALNSHTAPLLSVPTVDVTKENPPPSEQNNKTQRQPDGGGDDGGGDGGDRRSHCLDSFARDVRRVLDGLHRTAVQRNE
jgi:hypothetical protein